MNKKELNGLLIPQGNSSKFFEKIRINKERSKKCYSWWDVWDIDVWFLITMINILTEFRYKHTGFPTILINDFFEEYDNQIKGDKIAFYQECPDEIDKDLFDKRDEWCNNKWNQIIDEMIHLFKESSEEYCSKQFDYEKGSNEEYEQYCFYRKECRTKAFKLLNDYFDCLWI